jgi:nicotinamide N-methyltransferase
MVDIASLFVSLTAHHVLLLSDLLYFDASHNELTQSITLLLSRRPESRAFIAAGTTPVPQFFRLAILAGFEYQEQTHQSKSLQESDWCGTLPVVGLTRDELSARKAQVRWWSLWWSEAKLET